MTCEHSDLCRMLSAFEPGILPNDVFHAIARLVVLPTFVVIPLLRQGDRIMVSLQVRDAADPHYGLMLHPAGTVIRPSDASMSAVYDRLMAAELPSSTVKRGPIFVYIALDGIARGREISLVHWIELAESSVRSDLFDADALPASIVPTDYLRIAEAVAHFRAFHGNAPQS
jgi:hypothetical protein